jgi:short-subunit dehydrogenase
MMSNLRPITLVTGASSGIGAALAQVFAANGHELFLLARREQRLAALADTIAVAGGKRPQFMAIDLAKTNAGDRIAAALADRGIEPEIVINCAGFGLLGPASLLDRAHQLAMIDVNVRILTDLSLRWIDCVERNKGGILNVGSILGFMPGPEMAVYHATKAYVLSFTEALYQELKPQGIRVTLLCPGPMSTEFAVRTEGWLLRKLGRSTERVARDGYAGFMRGRRLVVPGFANRVSSLLPCLLPHEVMSSIIRGRIRIASDA